MNAVSWPRFGTAEYHARCAEGDEAINNYYSAALCWREAARLTADPELRAERRARSRRMLVCIGLRQPAVDDMPTKPTIVTKPKKAGLWSDV